MNEDRKKIKSILSKDEIQLKDILTILIVFIKELKFYFLGIFIITSFILSYSILNKKETFIAKANLLIEQNQVNNNSSNISKVLGINNLPPQEEMLGPSMYTEIVKSQVFLSDLLLEEVLLKENSNKKVKLYDLFIFNKSVLSSKNNFKDLKLASLSDIDNDISPKEIFKNKLPPLIRLSPTQKIAIEELRSKIKIEIQGRNLILKTEMNDPYQSAVLCRLVLVKLVNFIGDFKTFKQRQNLSIIEERFKEAELRYKEAQMRLANYKDKNAGIIFQSAQTIEQLLNNDLSVSFNIYNQFATQFEQAKVDLKKETPYFSIIEPINIPEESTFNYTKTIIKYYLFALIASLLILFVRAIRLFFLEKS
jgi:hypothetical protein